MHPLSINKKKIHNPKFEILEERNDKKAISNFCPFKSYLKVPSQHEETNIQ